jgi:hypothetical protein
MIKWYLMRARATKGVWPTAFIGRAGVTAALVLSTLALAPPPANRGSSSYHPPNSNAGPYAAAAIRLPTTRGNYGPTVPEHYRQLMLTRYAKALMIPAFARKYSLPCSACHTTWPELNAFGQKFRDNGYQLGNDRDAPIWQNPAYWPAAIRTSPQWHLESTTHQPVDAVRGDPTGGTVERTITQHGFDLSGVDLLFIGTLHKNISFGFVSAIENSGALGLEAAFVRFDDLLDTHWANVKLGKFELDNMVSEKRQFWLSANGGFYQSYHFVPVGSATTFGLGDNQLGVELSGHSINSYTRYGLALLEASDGEPGFNGAGHAYDGAFTFSQAFDAGSLGVQRIGAYAYMGQRPTAFETSGGAPIAGTGLLNKPFQRYGVVGDFYLGDLEFLPLYMRGSDDAYLATATAGDQPLPAGARSAQWNAGFLELHYYVNPQFVFLQRSEFIRMSQQALPSTPSNLGNIDAYTFGYRWYPMMHSRAGLALHTEFSMAKTLGAAPLSGAGVGLPPLSTDTPVWARSLLFALDFAF